MVQPYSINHNVAKGENAVNDCKACHNEDSRMTQSIKLANHAPVMPVFDAANNVNGSGEIVTGADGALYYQPVPANDKMYVFGSSRVNWIDWLGALAVRWLAAGCARAWDAEISRGAETGQGTGKDRTHLHVRTVSPLLALAANRIHRHPALHGFDHPQTRHLRRVLLPLVW